MISTGLGLHHYSPLRYFVLGWFRLTICRAVQVTRSRLLFRFGSSQGLLLRRSPVGFCFFSISLRSVSPPSPYCHNNTLNLIVVNNKVYFGMARSCHLNQSDCLCQIGTKVVHSVQLTSRAGWTAAVTLGCPYNDLNTRKAMSCGSLPVMPSEASETSPLPFLLCYAHDETGHRQNREHKPVPGLHDGHVIESCAWCGKTMTL